MPIENATYRDRLAHNRKKANDLYPGMEMFDFSKTAKIVGRCRQTISRQREAYGFVKDGKKYVTTVEKISRYQSRGR